MLKYARRRFQCRRCLGGENFDPPRECVDQNEDEHDAMSVCSQRAYVIQVDHLKWIVRGTCEGMRFDLNLQATHYLAAWALPDERVDHSDSNRGVVELGLTTMAHA